MDLPVDGEAMEGALRHARRRGSTTAEVIAAGAELDGWDPR